MKRKIIFAFFIILLLVCNLTVGFLGGYLGVNYADKFNFNKSTNNTSQSSPVKVVDTTEDAFIKVVDDAKNAVVSIIITKDLPVYEEYYSSPYGDDFYDFFFNRRMRRQIGEEEKQVGAGSGFVVSEDGYIITNRHVVEDESASYTVVFNDEEKAEAKVLARDTFLDIAVLKVEKTGLKYIKLADSEEIRVGQKVLAIGNALGEFSNTVSTGIVSGLSRSITAGSNSTGEYETLSGVIQTDASINPGNSGGPLLNISGEAIGVNVAVAANAENIGFAIPINSIKPIIESIQQYGKIVRPYLGVRYIQITSDLKEKNKLSVDYGALIQRGQSPTDLAILPGSPADKAGLSENDIILEVNGVKLDKKTSLQREIQKYKVGDEVKLKIISKGEEKEIKVKLEENE